MNSLLFLCAFTAVQLFSARYILEQHTTIADFANFVVASYRCGIGGGAIGALLAYPLYTYLGQWGGLIALLFVAAGCLLATGKAQKMYRWTRRQAEEGQHRSEQRRNIKKVERMFDYDEFEEEKPRPAPRPRPAPQQNPPRQPQQRPMRRVSDPEREFITLETPDPEQKKPAPRKAAKPRLYKETIDPNAAVDAQPEIEIDIPKPLRKLREEKPEGDAPRKRKSSFPKDEPDFFVIKDQPTDDSPFEPENYGEGSLKKNQVLEGVRAVTLDDDEDDEPPFDMPETKKTVRHTQTVPEPEIEEDEPYNYPPIDLLEQGDNFKVTQAHRDVDQEKAEKLIQTLGYFGIETRLVGVAHGPAVTRFELMPAPGVKVSRITALADDIAMHLAAMSVRIEAPIPGKAAVGVEIPNDKVEMVRLRDVLESGDAKRHPSRIAVALGKDNSGRYIVADIAKMPHVLIAGQTGSGKSVCINSIITSILYRATPEDVRMILIDPKVVELSMYNDIPHLIAPVVTDPKKAASALDWAVAEMAMRYKKFAERDVRDIKGYNKSLKPGEKKMPQMVIVIDELADLMMVAPGEVEDSICRLAQLARAAGMHLVIATQRPSVNVITGIIKANIPTRIAFLVASQVDSRTIVDHGGAEKLLGNGDMLFVPSGVNKPLRVQGAWVSEEEVHAIVSYIKARSEVTYDEDVVEKIENSIRSDAEREEVESDHDSRLEEAVEIVIEAGQASTSMLQRRMRVGYARAGRLIDEMERRGIISEADGSKPRNVLISREQMTMIFDDGEE
ncbi:MAG: DNA translocase FtsK [Clostridia bacterium]|nr:DNA translocase FtsK [Clostridia bacterium]